MTLTADELDHRTRTESGCIPPHLVQRLVELGHTGEVELQAGRGEWFCALDRARHHAWQGQQAEALEVVDPYVATGWWTAAASKAALLEEWGRVDEAIEVVRPHAAGGSPEALRFAARQLAWHGRVDEALDLLRPHVGDPLLAAGLVAIAKRAGRDEEAATLLEARIAAGDREPWTAAGLLAGIRERQGRVDEAIALLRTREVTSVNNRDALADLLARHGRVQELRDYAVTEVLGHAAHRLAMLLEERGDVEGAIAVYRQQRTSPAWFAKVPLAKLLARHGRGDEAVAVLRGLADGPGGAEDWIVDLLCTQYTDLGRPEAGLAYLEALDARGGGADWAFISIRVRMLVLCGRREEAIGHARAAVAAGTWHAPYAAVSLSELLVADGRVQEAVAVLEERSAPGLEHHLAGLLIGLGRVQEAVALLQRPRPRPDIEFSGPAGDVPPF